MSGSPALDAPAIQEKFEAMAFLATLIAEGVLEDDVALPERLRVHADTYAASSVRSATPRSSA